MKITTMTNASVRNTDTFLYEFPAVFTTFYKFISPFENRHAHLTHDINIESCRRQIIDSSELSSFKFQKEQFLARDVI